MPGLIKGSHARFHGLRLHGAQQLQQLHEAAEPAQRWEPSRWPGSATDGGGSVGPGPSGGDGDRGRNMEEWGSSWEE